MAVAVALVIAFALGASPPTAALSAPLAQWGGRISFALYLCHVPVLFTLRRIGMMPSLDRVGWRYAPNIVLYLACAVVVAFIARRFLEQPAKDAITNTVQAMSLFQRRYKEEHS